MKTGPISKAEAHYINSRTDLTDEEIAADLDRSVDLIKKHRMMVKNTPTPFMNLTKSTVSGVRVSTQAASELSDGVVKNSRGTQRYKDSVGKVFPD